MMEIMRSCPGLSPAHVAMVEDSIKYCADEEFIGEESSANLFHHLFRSLPTPGSHDTSYDEKFIRGEYSHSDHYGAKYNVR